MSMGYLLPPQRLHPHFLTFPVPSRAGGAGGEDFSVVYCGCAEVFFVFGEGEAAVEDYAADVAAFLFLFKLSYQPCRYIPVLGVYREQVFRHAYNVSRAYFDL